MEEERGGVKGNPPPCNDTWKVEESILVKKLGRGRGIKLPPELPAMIHRKLRKVIN